MRMSVLQVTKEKVKFKTFWRMKASGKIFIIYVTYKTKLVVVNEHNLEIVKSLLSKWREFEAGDVDEVCLLAVLMTPCLYCRRARRE